MSINNLSSLVLILLILPSSYSQLVCVETQAHFASGRYASSGIYDGSDSIYLVGGIPNGAYEISKYSVAADEVRVVSSLPLNRAAGTMSKDTEGNIYYHGGVRNGQYGTNEIFKYIPGNINPARAVGTIPWYNYFSIAFPKWDDPNIIYIMGGASYKEVIIAFNQTSSTSGRVGLIPTEYTLRTGVSDGAGRAYIFATIEGRTVVLKFNLTSFQVEAEVPLMEGFSFTGSPSAVWDGKNAWIIGGYGNWTTGPRPDTILRFDPESMQNEIVQVVGFPVSEVNATYLSTTNPIWVAGMKRIYMFGGYTRDSPGSDQTIHDKFWYIQLP